MIHFLSQFFSRPSTNEIDQKKNLIYFLRNGLWTIGGQGIVSIAALVITVSISRALSPADYGIYRYIMTIIPIFLLATLPNMGSALTIAIAQNKKVNLSKALRAKIRWGFLATIVGLFMALYYTITHQPLLAVTVALSAVCIPFFETFSLYKFILQGTHDFKTSAVYQSINRLIAAVCIVGVVAFTHNVTIIIATLLFSQIFSQWFFWKKTITRTHATGSDTDITTYGKHLSFLGILTTIGAQMDKLLVWFLFGPVALAIYSIVLAIPLEGTRLLESLATIVLPRFSTINWDDRKKRLFVVKRILLLLIPLMIGASLYLVFAHLIFSLLFPAYLPFIFLSKLASVLVIVVPLGDLSAQAFIAWGKLRSLLWIACIEILILLVGIYFASQTQSLFLAISTLIFKEVFVFSALTIALVFQGDTKSSKTHSTNH